MSKWRSEFAYLGRYAGSGALNTLIGFAVIFFLMWLGTSPLIANIGGYLVGLILGFFVSKRFVFRSNGHTHTESIRYFAAFLASFTLNLIVLQFSMKILHWNAIPSQLLAAGAYTGIMYLLTRWLVFRAGMNSSHLSK